MIKVANSSLIVAQPVYTIDPATGLPSAGGGGGGDASEATLAQVKTGIDSLVTAAQDTTTPAPVKIAQDEYEYVAASSTDTALGATGATGDYLAGVLVIPATTSPGAVQIKDGTAGTYRTIFTGGASSVGSLVPFFIPLGIKSIAAGGWIITTGSNVGCFAVGDFT